MQTNSLPIPFPVPGTQPQNQRGNAAPPSEGVNFGATLMRQIDQRQIEQRQLENRGAQMQPAMSPPTAVAGPKPQPAPKPVANEARAPAREPVRQAAKEPVKEGAHAAEPAGKTETTAARTDEAAGNEDAAAASSGARAADAVVDMLALMASLSGMQPAPAEPAASVLETAAAQSGALLAGMKGKPGDGSEALVKLGSDAATGGAQQGAGVDPRALELGKTADAANAANAADAARLPLEAGDFAAQLRDSAALAAASKETLPGAEALTSLTTQATALQNAQAAGAVPSDRLSARVGTPAWDNQVGQKVIWMVGGEEQSATLELNPPDLGPVQVVLNVSNDMASVTFSSQQLEVRHALENALPRLREMMGESGIALGNASVNAGNEGRQGQDGQGSGRPGGGNGKNSGDGTVAEVVPRQRSAILGGAGAVDTFA